MHRHAVVLSIGSISKSFTAVALGMLVEEGKLSWDDPVTQYLPYFQLYDPYVTREFTVRDLLAHRSGLPEFCGGILWYGSDFSREEVIKRLRYLAYGFGWFLRDYRGCKLVTHTGGMDGMAAVVLLVPEEKLGITVLSHQDGGIGSAVAYQILDAYLGAPKMDWARLVLKFREEGEQKEKEAEAKLVAARVQGTKPSLALERYAGKYRDRMYGDLSITQENGRLVLRFSHSPSFTADLEPWQYDTFRLHWRDPMDWPKGFLTFSLDAKGNIKGFDFDQPRLLDVNFDELSVTRVPDAP